MCARCGRPTLGLVRTTSGRTQFWAESTTRGCVRPNLERVPPRVGLRSANSSGWTRPNMGWARVELVLVRPLEVEPRAAPSGSEFWSSRPPRICARTVALRARIRTMLSGALTWAPELTSEVPRRSGMGCVWGVALRDGESAGRGWPIRRSISRICADPKIHEPEFCQKVGAQGSDSGQIPFVRRRIWPRHRFWTSRPIRRIGSCPHPSSERPTPSLERPTPNENPADPSSCRPWTARQHQHPTVLPLCCRPGHAPSQRRRARRSRACGIPGRRNGHCRNRPRRRRHRRRWSCSRRLRRAPKRQRGCWASWNARSWSAHLSHSTLKGGANRKSSDRPIFCWEAQRSDPCLHTPSTHHARKPAHIRSSWSLVPVCPHTLAMARTGFAQLRTDPKRHTHPTAPGDLGAPRAVLGPGDANLQARPRPQCRPRPAQ